MGYTSYSSDDRAGSLRASSYTKARSTGDFSSVFTQTKEGKAAADMIPSPTTMRESRDSTTHPFTIPIIFALDETGSMHDIPKHLIVDGLPTMIGGIIQDGFPDPQVLFLGFGDHECDHYPIQVGQFESGDEEMDHWLTKIFLEGKGGGNMGESYALPWYFAAKHTVTDSYEKRGIKGLLFTVGDEPCLPMYHPSSLGYAKTALAPHQGDKITADECLALAQEKYEVYHLHITENRGDYSLAAWQHRLGQHCIEVKDYTKIPSIVKKIVIDYYKSVSGKLGKLAVSHKKADETASTPDDKKPLML